MGVSATGQGQAKDHPVIGNAAKRGAPVKPFLRQDETIGGFAITAGKLMEQVEAAAIRVDFKNHALV